MATIVRVKRKRNVEAAQSIVVSCKKVKSDEAYNETNDEKDCQSYLKFAGTVTSKGEVISKHIKDAIRKEKIQKEYKRHQPIVLHKNRRRQKESSKANRFKITSTFRALDLSDLDKEEEEKDGETNSSSIQSKEDVCEKCFREKEKSHEPVERTAEKAISRTVRGTVICKCNCGKEDVNSEKNVNTNPSVSNSSVNGASAAEKVYHLYDVEDTESKLPTMESLMQEAQNASFITCNSEQMVHERVQADEQEDYVYDLYYTNSRDFNLQLLESSLSIHPSSEHFLEYANNEEEEYEVYEDEDDENEECNWRNDYPDEEPRIFNNEEVDYIYGNGNADYQVFDYDDRGLAEWMSSGCHIGEDAEGSSSEDTDDDYPSSYEKYKKRVTKELKIDNS